MKIIGFFLLVCSSMAFACEITLPHQLVVLGSQGHSGSAIKSSMCPENIIQDLHSIISEVDGRISAAQLNQMMESKGHPELAIAPYMIQVQQLKNIIREQLLMPSGIQIKSTSPVNMPSLLALSPGDKLEVRCTQCLYGSQQVVNILVREFDGASKEFLASADFKRMVRAYRLMAPIHSFSALSANELKEEYTEAVPHTDLVTDTELLKFYKTNKPLKTGELLRFSDLNAVNLVRAGLKTDVILENTMVRIKTQGISRSNGAIGDVVEVFHQQKNKKYQGKVIDNNKVLVEL